MEEGKRVTRNMAKTAASLEKNAYNDHQKRSRNVPGSGDRHDNEEPVVSVRPPIRSFGKGKMQEKKATKTKSSDSESDDGSDYDSEGNFREEPKRPPFSEDEEVEEKGNRHQQRDPVNSTLDFDTRPQNRFSDVEDERKISCQQRGGVKYQRSVVRRSQATDPVNSSLNFETSAQTSFSDGEDEKKIPYHQQQRGGVRPKTSVIRSSLATEERKVTPNNTGFAPLDWTNNIGKYLLLLLVVLGVLAAFALRPLILKKQETHKVDEVQVMKKFYDGFRKLQINFPSQSQALWSRSQRILELHLLNKDNKQPAIILLTAAQDAEQTLHCVGNKLAKTYASSLNSNYTVISGPDRKSEDSEDVKEEIDDKLSEGFQGTARAAVLHRLELLPPGSLLILYKYCDHENANFKNVALVLTVLLDDSTLTPDIPLSDLEEKVRDFFGKTFIVSDTKKSHNEMDVDKLSGVWSRISHVVLPVFPEKDVGKQCEETETKV